MSRGRSSGELAHSNRARLAPSCDSPRGRRRARDPRRCSQRIAQTNGVSPRGRDPAAPRNPDPAVGRKNRITVPAHRQDMMQPAEHRPTDDLACRVGYGRRHPPARRPLAQAPMRSPLIEVRNVLVQHPLKVALVEDEHMVQTLTPRRSDPPLSKRFRPRRPHRRADPRDRSNSIPNRPSRSRIRYRGESRSRPHAPTTCWAAHAAVGC